MLESKRRITSAEVVDTYQAFGFVFVVKVQQDL